MKRTRVRRNLKSALYCLCWVTLLLIALSKLGYSIEDKEYAFMFILGGGITLAYLVFPHSIFDKESISLYRTEEFKLKRFIRSNYERIEFSIQPLDNGFVTEKGKLTIDISKIRRGDASLIEAEFGIKALVHTDLRNDSDKENNRKTDRWVLLYFMLVLIPLGCIVFGFSQLVFHFLL